MSTTPETDLDPRAKGDAPADHAVVAARLLALALGGVTFVLFAWVVVARFRYPVDGEWMVGAVRDGVRRVRDGEPLYGPPSERFIAFVYPPLYYGVCAIVARFCSVFVACKLVSLAATTGLAAGIFWIARKLGATRFWAAVGVLLHFGSYAMTLMFYDLERVDAFAAAIVILGLVTLLSGEGLGRTAAGGAVLGLAFFAKQPHLLAFGAAVFALFVARERKRALVCGVAGAVTFALAFAFLELRTGSWFRYYCMKLPGSHGLEPRVLSVFFVTDLPKGFMLAAASVALGAPLALSLVTRRRPPDGDTWREVLFAAIVATTMIEAFFLRAHRGGWSNVIIAWTPFACAAVSVVAARVEARAKGTSMARATSLILLGGVSLELLGGVFDPGDAAPNADDWAERQHLVALVRELETKGEVVVTTTGDLTRPPHFQMAALFDILRAGDPLPPDIERALQDRKYAAIFVGRPQEFQCDGARCDAAFAALGSSYFVAARREEREHSGTSGFDARPRWIMRPRKEPLAPMSRDALERRLETEMGLAEAHARALPQGADPIIDDSIETRAKAP